MKIASLGEAAAPSLLPAFSQTKSHTRRKAGEIARALRLSDTHPIRVEFPHFIISDGNDKLQWLVSVILLNTPKQGPIPKNWEINLFVHHSLECN